MKINGKDELLSDETMIGDKTWRDLKSKGIKPDYSDPSLSPSDQALLKKIIAAQISQGDMNELRNGSHKYQELQKIQIKELDF